MPETRPIEWPPGSGVIGEYAPGEEAFLRELIGGCERGFLDERQLQREVGILHELKAVLAAIIIDTADDRGDFIPSPPDSPFQIPPRAQDLLDAHDPQLRIE